MKIIKFDSHNAEIMSVFPPAIENCDYSGLEADEIKLLSQWLEDQPEGAIFQYSTELKYSTCSNFGYCDILNMHGDTVEVRVNYNMHEEEIPRDTIIEDILEGMEDWDYDDIVSYAVECRKKELVTESDEMIAALYHEMKDAERSPT